MHDYCDLNMFNISGKCTEGGSLEPMLPSVLA